jgi:hypothetical protein
MPRKKKPNLQQQKTIKKERELNALKIKADEFRQLLEKEKESIDNKIDLKNCLYSI